MMTARFLRSSGFAVAAVVIAVLAFPFAVTANLRSACVERDTPYLPICPEPLTDSSAVREQLKTRIRRNPGDSRAWADLLVSGTPTQAESALPGAVLVAPNNHNVAQWNAAEALQHGQAQRGIDLMIGLLRHRRSPETARVIAQIAASPSALKLLQPHLPTAAEWLPQVLEASYALKLRPGDLLSLVAAAMENGAVPDAAVEQYMRMLKSSGDWLDAYGLWLGRHKEFVPLLYNGSFDQPFERDGFDWEFANDRRSRAGTRIEQEAVARRGLVLDVEFTGRSFPAPILRQLLFLPPGTYRLRGEYMASKLRSEEGLAWSIQCMSGRKGTLGRSPAMRETGGVWKSTEVEFTVSSECGPVASLQLDPVASYESAMGIRGEISFDAFSLTRALPVQ